MMALQAKAGKGDSFINLFIIENPKLPLQVRTTSIKIQLVSLNMAMLAVIISLLITLIIEEGFKVGEKLRI